MEPCACKDNVEGTYWDNDCIQGLCSGVGLFNCVRGPSVRKLSDQYDPSTTYFDMYSATGVANRIRHWYFLFQVVGAQGFMRPEVQAQDRWGNKTRVIWYLDNGTTLPFEHMLVPGNTVAVLDAESKTFMDGSRGVRLEDESIPNTAVFRAPIDRVVDEGTRLAVRAFHGLCCECGAVADQRCSRCRVAVYCSAGCQRTGWRARHKALCGDAAVLQGLGRLGHIDGRDVDAELKAWDPEDYSTPCFREPDDFPSMAQIVARTRAPSK